MQLFDAQTSRLLPECAARSCRGKPAEAAQRGTVGKMPTPQDRWRTAQEHSCHLNKQQGECELGEC